MTEVPLNLFESFLVSLDRTLEKKRLRPLKNCQVHSDFLSLLRFDKLEQLLNLLEACEPDSQTEDILDKVRLEIIYRHLVRVPRDFHYLYEFLNARFPEDPLTKALPNLIKEMAEAEDWKSEEVAYLGCLREIRKNKSRFDTIIRRYLGTLKSESVPIYLAFIKRPNSEISTLLDEYVPRAIVRRIIPVKPTDDNTNIFADSGLKIRDDFSNTVRLVQTQAFQFLQSRIVDKEVSYIQYMFADPMDHINSLQIEGRSAALAIAASVFIYLSPSFFEYRDLAPYIAYFGSYTWNSFDEVDSLQEKVEAAREQGVRVIVIAESSKEIIDHYAGCEPVDFPNSSLGEVLKAVIEKVTPIARKVSYQLRQTETEEVTSEILEYEEEPITWAHLQSVAEKQKWENISKIEGDINTESKYVQRLYVNREEIESGSGLFHQFMSSNKAIFLVLGESGYGKTNLMCHLTKHRDMEEDCSVFFYEARNVTTFNAQFCYDLKISDINALIRELNQGRLRGKKVIVFVDAINEHYNPFDLMQELMLLCNEQSENPGLRFVVSCRTPFWEDMQESLEGFSPLLYSIVAKENYPTLGKFKDENDEDELASAFRKYREAYYLKTDLGELSAESRGLIQDPYILKLVAKTYSEIDGIIPPHLEIQTVFEAYENSRYPKELYKQDKEFIDEILRWMWQNCSDRLKQEIIDSNFNLWKIVHMDDPTRDRFSATTYVCNNCKLSLPKNLANHSECPRCHSRDLLSVRSDKRTAFDRLRDEGILKKDEDGAIRFTYDRYYEYRTAKWLLEQNGGELTADKVRELAMDDGQARSRTPLQALKQAILMVSDPGNLLVELARSEEQAVLDITEDCIVRFAGEADASDVFSRLTEIGGNARLIAIRAARDADVYDKCPEPILAPIAPNGDARSVSLAITHTLSNICIREGERERGLQLLGRMAKFVTIRNLLRGNTAALQIMLGVTLRTVGILHNDPAVAFRFRDFWRRILSTKLYLGNRSILGQLVSPITRRAIVSAASIMMTNRLKGYGISTGKADRNFSDKETDAIFTLFDALSEREAFEMIPEIWHEHGLESSDSQKRSSPCATIAYMLICPVLAAQAEIDSSNVIQKCSKMFESSRGLHNNGGGTRYLVYAQLNFIAQFYYNSWTKEKLMPYLDTMLRHYRWALEESPEDLMDNPISREFPGVTSVTFGLFFEIAALLSDDYVSDIIRPLLATAKKHPDLIRAYLGQASVCCLDTFCRRHSTYRKFLDSLELFCDFKGLSSELNIDAGDLTKWVIEAYAIVSVGFTSEVESVIINQKRNYMLPQIREARSKRSNLLDMHESATLEEEVNRMAEIWSLSDSAHEILIHVPGLRKVFIEYAKDYLGSKDKVLRDLLKHALRDLVDYIANDSESATERQGND